MGHPLPPLSLSFSPYRLISRCSVCMPADRHITFKEFGACIACRPVLSTLLHWFKTHNSQLSREPCTQGLGNTNTLPPFRQWCITSHWSPSFHQSAFHPSASPLLFPISLCVLIFSKSDFQLFNISACFFLTCGMELQKCSVVQSHCMVQGQFLYSVSEIQICGIMRYAHRPY